MTQRLPSTNAKMVDPSTGLIQSVWINFLKQFASAPPAISEIALTGSPFSITANNNGTMSIIGGTVSSTILTRGQTDIDVSSSKLIPISIGDTLTVSYSTAPQIQFIPSS